MTSTDSWDAVDLLIWPWHFLTFPKGNEKLWFSTSDLGRVPDLRNCLPFTFTSTDSWDAVDVHPICYFDHDIFPTFPKGHEKLWFFNFRPWTGATLCGPDHRNLLPFTLDNDFYRQLRCCRCASNLLFWPWHFSDLSKRSRTTLILQLNTFHGCHFVGTRSQKLFAIYLR